MTDEKLFAVSLTWQEWAHLTQRIVRSKPVNKLEARSVVKLALQLVLHARSVDYPFSVEEEIALTDLAESLEDSQ